MKCAWPIITLRSALGFEISTVLSSIDIALCDGWLQDDKAVEAGPKGVGGGTPRPHTGQAAGPAPRAPGLPRFFLRPPRAPRADFPLVRSHPRVALSLERA